MVADGDTLTLRVDRQEVRVRLAGIDAPEHGQPFGQAARESLATLVAGRTVNVRAFGHDSYGRVLGNVYAAGVDVNAEQVRRGYAWVFRRFSNDKKLLALEADARAARRGLWRDRAPVAPWIWREQVQAGRVAALGLFRGGNAAPRWPRAVTAARYTGRLVLWRSDFGRSQLL